MFDDISWDERIRLAWIEFESEQHEIDFDQGNNRKTDFEIFKAIVDDLTDIAYRNGQLSMYPD